MKVQESFALTESVEKLKKLCKAFKVEINVNSKGDCAIWAELDKCDITIDSPKVDDIPAAIQALELMRKCGWKSV